MEDSPLFSPTSFYSVAQSFSPESAALSDTPTPPPAQLDNNHLPNSPFADPPIFPSTVPSLGHSVERVQGVGRSHRISPDDDVSDYSRDYADGCGCRSLDPLAVSPRVRSCDVYVGVCRGRRQVMMVQFVKWLRAELEMQGVSCFVVDRSRCKSAYDHSIAKTAMDAASFGVVVVTERSFGSPYSMEEIRFLLEKKKLILIFFEIVQVECAARDIIERRGEIWEQYGGRLWELYGGLEDEWRNTVNGMARLNLKLEANAGNFRDCVSEAVVILASGLGRKRVVERVMSWKNLAAEEFPFPQNSNFVGRNKELLKLELLLFGDAEGEGEDECTEGRSRRRHKRAEVSIRERVANEAEERRRKGKEPMVWKKSFTEIKAQAEHVMVERNASMHGRVNGTVKLEHGNGIACVSGNSGIGKTELLLEYAYRYSQRYKMILWVGGESRYLRQNYMKLMPLLGIDTGMVNKLCSEKNEPQSLEDIEGEAIRKVRKELNRDIPYLLVIDNLERETDWWDGRHIMELLPRLGGATHVLISTRLPRIMNIEPMRLIYLSSAEARFLMIGIRCDLGIEEVDALRLLEEMVGRLPLGLALVGAVLSEFPMKPSELLDAINSIPYRELMWNNEEDLVLRHNPFLGQLLEFCFTLCDQEPSKLAMQMVQASGLFAPSSIPISMLVLAAKESFRESQGSQFWIKHRCMATCMCMVTPRAKRSEAEVLAVLLKFRIAKSSTKTDYISFHDIVKLYACKRGDSGIADSVVRAISFKATLPQHSEHIWAACFLVFKFDINQVVIDLPIHDLLSFIEQFVLPLAMHGFTYFRCNAILELLRLATEKLEALENSFLSEASNGRSKSSCFGSSGSRSTLQSNPLVYQKFAHVRATLLETRAKIMLRGGLYDIGETLCRTAVSIKEVIYGWEHPETMSSRETLDRLIRLQSSF